VLSVIAGADPCDATTSTDSVPDFAASLTGRVSDIRIGVPRAFVTEGVDDQVRRAYEAALERLRGEGATLVDIDLPHAKYAVPVYYLVCTAEASSNLARYDGVKYGYRSSAAKDSLKEMYSRTRDEGFGPEVKRRIMLGTYVLSAGYDDADAPFQARGKNRRSVADVSRRRFHRERQPRRAPGHQRAMRLLE